MTEQNVMIRRIGYLSGMGLVMGSMIGSGIFMSPGSVLASSGSVGLSFIMWASCGIISSLGFVSLNFNFRPNNNSIQ